MELPKIVHAWELEGYAKVNKELRDLIRDGLKKKYGSLHKAELALGLSDYYHRKLHETFTRKDILFRLIKEAEIKKKKAEKYIEEWLDTTFHKGYKIKFPIKLNLAHIRVISHLIGDGSMGKNFIWTQKDVSPLEKIEEKLFGRSLKNRKGAITIPRILIKITSKSLDLPLENLNKKILLKKLILLPRQYKVQLLTALIEDEGTVDKNRVTIRMGNKELMVLITELIDSLRYPRSNLTKQKYKRYGEYKSIWKIDINIEGIKKYYSDLEEIEKIYGSLLGLWKKKQAVRELSMHKSNLSGWKRNKKIRTKILKLGRFKNICFNSIKRQFNLTDDKTASILRYMINKKDIKRINRGVYKIN